VVNHSIYKVYPENYDQNNPYHNLDLHTHVKRVSQNAIDGDIFAGMKNERMLHRAVYYHDIGKPLTRSFKTPDHCSYIGRDNVSAYIFASTSMAYQSDLEGLNLALLLISFHIQVRYTKMAKLRKFIGADNYALLLKLEDCDTRGKD